MKRILIALISLAAVSCSGKRVPDVGPQFRLSSSELSLSDVSTATLNLKRQEEELGPTFQIHTKDPQDIAKSYKTLLCGPVSITGAVGVAPDPELLSFKLSNSKFPGLKELPLKTNCLLSVTLENKVGSTVTRDFAMKLNFDVNPALTVSRRVLAQGIMDFKMDRLIEMETIIITNNFKYPVGYTYTLGQYTCDLYVTYRVTKSREPMHQCGERMNLPASSFLITGNYVTIENDPLTHISIQIPPGESVTVKAYGKVAEKYPYYKDSEMYGPNGFQLSGVNVFECTYYTKNTSSSLFRDFNLSREDINSPNTFPIPSITFYPPMGQHCPVNAQLAK